MARQTNRLFAYSRLCSGYVYLTRHSLFALLANLRIGEHKERTSSSSRSQTQGRRSAYSSARLRCFSSLELDRRSAPSARNTHIKREKRAQWCRRLCQPFNRDAVLVSAPCATLFALPANSGERCVSAAFASPVMTPERLPAVAAGGRGGEGEGGGHCYDCN